MTRPAFSRLRMLVATLAALLLPLCAAFGAKVSGALSSSTASVGETIEFEIVVSSSERALRPELPLIDGLEVAFAGGGQRSTMIFGGANSSVETTYTFTFNLVPKREGKFTIPALEVRVGGQVLRTQPVTLTVAPPEEMKEAGDLAFGKISVPKKTLFLGETAPMEVRLYLDANADWGNLSLPSLSGDGFTMRPFAKPSQRDTVLSGKRYHLLTFSTVITPGRAGKVSVGPVPVNLAVSKPDPRRVDFLGRPMMGPGREMTVTAPAVEIEVKPLPVAGRPKDFSGAVGKFEFEASGTPHRVKVGEPVSMKLTIKGSGNFDRIGQPQLADPAGWTAYSAKENFQGDSGATEGVKTFELPVTPTTNKTMMPVFSFSYFDPEAEKYVTLKSASEPLLVEGAPVASAPTPVPSAGKTPEPAKEPAKPAVQDILPNLPDIGPASAAFGPSFSPAVFFSMMFAPVPVAFAFIAWRRRRGNAKLARFAALRRERAALMAQVKGAAGRAEVFDAAVKALRVGLEIECGAQPGDDAAALLGTRKLDPETEKSLREIFDARAELLYAGAAREGDRIGERDRDRVLDALANFEKSPRQ